jgi:hypothetical protein
MGNQLEACLGRVNPKNKKKWIISEIEPLRMFPNIYDPMLLCTNVKDFKSEDKILIKDDQFCSIQNFADF